MSIIIKYRSGIDIAEPINIFKDTIFQKNLTLITQDKNELFKYINDELEPLELLSSSLNFELDNDAGLIYSIITYATKRAPTEAELSTIIDLTTAQLSDGYYEEPISIETQKGAVYLSVLDDDNLYPVSVESTSDFITTSSAKCSKALEDDIRKGNTAKLEAYIKKGGDVNCRNAWNQPLLLTATVSPNPASALLLIESGADIHVRDDTGQSALLKVGYSGHTEVAKLLIAKGADVNLADETGQSPIMLAANRNYFDLVSLLLKHQATIGEKCTHGRSALTYTSSVEVVRLLLKAGKDVYTKQDITSALESFTEELEDVKDYQTPEVIREHEVIVEVVNNHLLSMA